MTNANMTALSADVPVPSSAVLLACQSVMATSGAPDHCLSKEKSPLGAPFTLSELNYALRRLQHKAGPHDLSNQELQNMPVLSKPWLLAWLSFVWDTGEVPEIWKTALVVPVLKPVFVKPGRVRTGPFPVPPNKWSGWCNVASPGSWKGTAACLST